MWPLTSKKITYVHSSPIVEVCWKIRKRVEDRISREACSVLAITSAGKLEGKTTTAVNLAYNYAKNNKKVLLIDANLRQPTLHKVFGISNRNGLTNLLSDRFEKSDIIRFSMTPNLFVIPSGSNTVDPIELLTSNDLGCFLNELRQEFDLIIIDTPSALDSADAQIAASMSDGVLLVIKEGRVKREQALKLKRAMEQVNTEILGAVMNRLRK